MGQDFFTYLPSEVVLDILSRLPVRTTLSCKCVCKSWCNLIETSEFVKSYKSVPSLIVFQGETRSKPYGVYEFVDKLNHENSENSCNMVFNFPHRLGLIHSSVNGLLLLFDRNMDLIICNPITREYIKLCHGSFDICGFGVNKITHQYKIVSMFHLWYEISYSPPFMERQLDETVYCQVYTLGTGLWRSIAPSISLVYKYHIIGAFLNGNIHMLASDLKGSLLISCFDLETELFTTLSPPHLDSDDACTLSALRDCLCLCDNSCEKEIVIWLMNSYGDEKSWVKQFVIAKMEPRSRCCGLLSVAKVFKDGDILITEGGCSEMIYYSNKTKTILVSDLIELTDDDYSSALLYPKLSSTQNLRNGECKLILISRCCFL